MNVKVATDIARKALLPILWALMLTSSISCKVAEVAFSEAEGVVSSVQLDNDVTSDHQGNPDYAVTVYCTIRNIGKEGKIQVTYLLTSSEGDWEKTDDLYFRAGETRSLKKLFPEPSIGATDIRGYVKVYPEPISSN